LVSVDPRQDAYNLMAGAVLLGTAVALTLAPVLWLAGFVRMRGIAYRGDWGRALRRAGLVGLAIVLFVVLSAQNLLSPPIAVFIVVMAVLIEVTMSLRR
jgi:hypothetical protein